MNGPDEATPKAGGEPSAAETKRLRKDPLVGTRLGKYEILGVLGRGGMGVVYEALDDVMGRNVAVKLLPESVEDDPETLRRFLREARAAGRISHANAVQVFDVGEHAGAHFIVMELVRGGSAADLLKSAAAAGAPGLDWRDATRIAAEACRGLEAAHQVGLVHRDIKPANLMLSAEGVVKVADFGLAKGDGESGKSLTGTGAVVGTPQYMSPEQAQSRPTDARSDVYSMGATYFSLLTGRPPFVSATPLAVLFAHCSQPVPDPRELRPEIPGRCAAVVRRAMAKEPADRFQTAGEMSDALEAALAGDDGPDDDSVPELAEAAATMPVAALRNPSGAAAPRPPSAPVSPATFSESSSQFDGVPETVAFPAGPVAPGPSLNTTRRQPAATIPTPRRAAPGGAMPAWVIPAAAVTGALVVLAVFAAVRNGGTGSKGTGTSVAAGGATGTATSATPTGTSDPEPTPPGTSDPPGTVEPPTPTPAPPTPTPPTPTPTPTPTPKTDPHPPVPEPEGPKPLRVLTGHEGPVNAAVFDRRTGELITAGDDGRVMIWGAGADKPLANLDAGHAGGVTAVISGENRLATGGRDGTLRLWEREPGVGLRPMAEFADTHSGPIRGLWATPGLILSVGGSEDGVRWTKWAWKRREEPGIGRPLSAPGTCVAVADDGDRYAAGTETGAVSLGDIGMGQVEIRAHSGRVRGVAFTSGHSHLVTAGEDGLVLLWDTANPERVMLWARTGLREPVVVRSGGGPVAAVACSQWNDVFADASADGTVRLHRVSDAAPVAVFRHGTPVRALAFAAREALLASAGDDGTVKLWDWSPYTEWKSLRPRATWTAHKGRVSALAFSPDGRTVGSGGVDGAVGFWESAAGAGRASPGGADIACVAFSRDGSAALSVASDGLARRFRPDPAGNWGAGPAPEAVRLQEGSPCRFAVSADLALVATIVDNPKTGRPRLWDIPSGRERTGFPEVADAGYEIVLSPDGREVIVGLDSRHARVLSTADGREIIRLASGFPPPGAAVYLPDGKSIAAWSIDRLAKVVDAGSGRETRRLRVSSRYFGFSADGAWLAAAAPGGTVELREAESGRLRAVLSIGSLNSAVTMAAISRDGRTVAAGTEDGVICVWDVSPFTAPRR